MACLVGVGIDGVYPSLASSTVGLGLADRVADSAVGQPARTTLVQALLPGSIEFASGCQGGIEFLTVRHCLIVGEAIIITCVENLT